MLVKYQLNYTSLDLRLTSIGVVFVNLGTKLRPAKQFFLFVNISLSKNLSNVYLRCKTVFDEISLYLMLYLETKIFAEMVIGIIELSISLLPST